MAALVLLFALIPFGIGYFAPGRRIALAVALAIVVVLSFAPFGLDQPAPWQHGYPGDGDWRVVAFPFWAVASLVFVRFGTALRRRRATGV